MADHFFEGAGGARIAADIFGVGQPVLLLHGGGQTRGSWRRTAVQLAQLGYQAITYDARGHGDSDWAPDGYTLDTFADDLLAVLGQVEGRPALIGASLGGLTSMLALGKRDSSIASALVLADITTRIDPKGAQQIHAFMTANPDGFETVEEAANAVSRYMTDRPRPADVSGLRRNLRERAGRLYWHWDPNFMTPRTSPGDFEASMTRLDAAAATIDIPTLLVRGEHSEIVNDAGVARLKELIHDAKVVEVRGAGHMVAGDANTPFADAVIEFLGAAYPV